MTPDDLRRVNCVHCGQVLAHHARAAQQVAVINQMMVDSNGNGIPDAFEGIAANATRNAYGQMGQNLGIGAQNGVALGNALGGMQQGIHGPSPYAGAGPYGGAPNAIGHMQPMMGGAFVANPNYMHVAQANAMNRGMRTTFIILGVVVGLAVVLAIAGAVFALVLTRPV